MRPVSANLLALLSCIDRAPNGGIPHIRGPADEEWFKTQDEARAWLRERKFDGSVSDGDRVVETVPAGE